MVEFLIEYGQHGLLSSRDSGKSERIGCAVGMHSSGHTTSPSSLFPKSGRHVLIWKTETRRERLMCGEEAACRPPTSSPCRPFRAGCCCCCCSPHDAAAYLDGAFLATTAPAMSGGGWTGAVRRPPFIANDGTGGGWWPHGLASVCRVLIPPSPGWAPPRHNAHRTRWLLDAWGGPQRPPLVRAGVARRFTPQSIGAY